MKLLKSKKLTHQEVSNLESILEKSLIKVSPTDDFVKDLERRLAYSAIKNSSPAYSHNKSHQLVIFSLIGLMGSMVLLVTSVKTLITILGGIGLLHQLRSQNRSQASPLQAKN